MGDAQHLCVGCAYAYERSASRDRAHGAVAVFAPVKRMGEDILDGLPGSTCCRLAKYRPAPLRATAVA